MRYVEKYGRAGQAIDVNIIQRTRFACWKTKLHPGYNNVFPWKQW